MYEVRMFNLAEDMLKLVKEYRDRSRLDPSYFNLYVSARQRYEGIKSTIHIEAHLDLLSDLEKELLK
jgi:hypothetical protein